MLIIRVRRHRIMFSKRQIKGPRSWLDGIYVDTLCRISCVQV